MVATQQNKQQAIKRPSLLLYLTEGFRAIRERVQSIKFRKEFVPLIKGDGHPVLVIPGFITDDSSTKGLRNFIDKIGYQSYPWELGRNYANLEDINTLLDKLEVIYAQHQQKISLIGWSLGGVYARELAKAKPHLIRQVITLGSPFGGIQEPNNATWLFNLIQGKKAQELDKEWLATLPTPAPVPTTALYSKKDGVVPWQVCRERIEDALHQNVEVRSSHVGMGYNQEVFVIIADRLPYAEENWQLYR